MAAPVAVSVGDVTTTDPQLLIAAFNLGHASGDKASDFLSAQWSASTFQSSSYGVHESALQSCWVGRRGPILWPPRSPDLTPLYFLLWGLMKEICCRTKAYTKDKLLRHTMEAYCYF
jgi:hypothetical protein